MGNPPSNLSPRSDSSITTAEMRAILRSLENSVELYSLERYQTFRQLRQQHAGTDGQIATRFILKALALLAENYPKDAQLLQERFIEKKSVKKLMLERHVRENKLYQDQRRSIERLIELIHRQEAQEKSIHQSRLLGRLEPASYQSPVGLDGQLEPLIERILEDGPPWLIALYGIGGIGKTTFADILLRTLIEQSRVDDVAWVTAQRTHLFRHGSLHEANKPALSADELVMQLASQLFGPEFSQTGIALTEARSRVHDRLKAFPHLVVIDNLETVIDIDEVLPLLQNWSAPSKFLLTSRWNVTQAADVYPVSIPELSASNAFTLIRQEAEWRNLLSLAAADDAELQTIYDIVGGNPLALRLIVGQTHLYPLSTVLRDLLHARSVSAESIYTYIYAQAWDRLDKSQQHVLLAMPLVPERGADLVYISGITQLEQAELRKGLNDLLLLNLVEVRGDHHARSYTIHNLTRSFLQNQVTKWQSI